MPTSIYEQTVRTALSSARAAGAAGTAVRQVGGTNLQARYPFPSPQDWRSCPVYFLLADRFNNPSCAPRSGQWDGLYGNWQGGSFRGIQAQLPYIAAMGMRAIWLTPVVKNCSAGWDYQYTGYNAQNLLAIDPRLGAEQELQDLVTEAHARGLYVILDIVLNHTGRVFDYVWNGGVTDNVASQQLIDAPLGAEPPIQWLDGNGLPRNDWQDGFPLGTALSPDDAVYPDELRERLFFRRRGSKLTDDAAKGSFVRGDFGTMRQLVHEYDASDPGQLQVRKALGPRPVLTILVQCYEYLIARFDFDGFRIDTVKYVDPDIVQTFGNAIREFAASIGKQNFFTFGEIFDDEETINSFVGRQGTATEGFGIDAALDFPLVYVLPGIAKGLQPVEQLRSVFETRKKYEAGLISSHGEAGNFFVGFVENHDQRERFHHPATPTDQVTLGLGLLFALQDIPCLYYGTEQGLDGTKDAQGESNVGSSLECVREALWGKPNAFDQTHPLYLQVRALSALRGAQPPALAGAPALPPPLPALAYGRQYFREVSQNGADFGHSAGAGGVVAFSRILGDQEVVVVANTNAIQRFIGFVLVDPDINRKTARFTVTHSNKGTRGGGPPVIGPINIWKSNRLDVTIEMGKVYVDLAPMEIQILAP